MNCEYSGLACEEMHLDFVYCVRKACALGKKMCWAEQELVHTRPFLRVVRDREWLKTLSESSLSVGYNEKGKKGRRANGERAGERTVQPHRDSRPSSIFSATLGHSISGCICVRLQLGCSRITQVIVPPKHGSERRGRGATPGINS